MNVPIRPGDVIRVAEPDYCYGIGLLILRVTEVGPTQQQKDGPWISLCGLELGRTQEAATVTTTYLTAAAHERLDQAQVALYDHLLADGGGRCLSCDEPEPCRRRQELTETILRYGSLPQRRPGQMKHGLRSGAVRS